VNEAEQFAGILIIDKPADWTSFDVVAKLRGALGVRKIGHGGTLDPMATGVLPVFVGREYTKRVSLGDFAEKEYVAGLRLGVTTDTQDTTGTVLREIPTSVTREELTLALQSFRGEQSQIPPMYSAVKIGGKRLYEIARRGGEVEREPRKITVFDAEILEGADADWLVRFVVSKGTYIRTLCADLGEKLGFGGVMSSLRRTRVGDYRVEDAIKISEAVELAQSGEIIGKFLRE